MSEEFEINEVQNTFDFRGFLFKLISYWPLFLISLAIGFGIAYYINVRKLPIYRMENMISIKDDQNPFFTTNTSLTFNWGGTTDKVNTAIITLRSRTHNEKVVERLQYYLNYRVDGKYQLVDAYKRTPFTVKVDTTKPQILGKQLRVIFKDTVSFTLKADFSGGMHTLQYYKGEKEKIRKHFEAQKFERDFRMGEKIDLPFFSGQLLPNPDVQVVPGRIYYLNFINFDSAVGSFSRIGVQPESKGSSVLKLNLTGTNKAKLVDFLNASVQVLSEDMLERKNLFATNTIKFIDSSLQAKSKELLGVEDELNQFKSDSEIFDLDTEGEVGTGTQLL